MVNELLLSRVFHFLEVLGGMMQQLFDYGGGHSIQLLGQLVPSRLAIVQRPMVDHLAPGFGQLLTAYLFGVSPDAGYQRHRIQALPPIGESAGLFIHYQLRGVDGLPQGSGIGLGH